MSDGDCGEAHELKSKPVEKPAKKTATLPSNKEMWNESEDSILTLINFDITYVM